MNAGCLVGGELTLRLPVPVRVRLALAPQYSQKVTTDGNGNQIVTPDYGTQRNGDSRCPLWESPIVCSFGAQYCTKTIQVARCTPCDSSPARLPHYALTP